MPPLSWSPQEAKTETEAKAEIRHLREEHGSWKKRIFAWDPHGNEVMNESKEWSAVHEVGKENQKMSRGFQHTSIDRGSRHLAPPCYTQGHEQVLQQTSRLQQIPRPLQSPRWLQTPRPLQSHHDLQDHPPLRHQQLSMRWLLCSHLQVPNWRCLLSSPLTKPTTRLSSAWSPKKDFNK